MSSPNVPRDHRRAQPARRSSARARGRRRRAAAGCRRPRHGCSRVGARGSRRRQTLLDGADAIDVIGRQPARGWPSRPRSCSARARACAASAHETVDWLHGAIYTALPGHRALLVPGTPDADAEVAVVVGGAAGRPCRAWRPLSALPAGGAGVGDRRPPAVAEHPGRATLWSARDGTTQGDLESMSAGTLDQIGGDRPYDPRRCRYNEVEVPRCALVPPASALLLTALLAAACSGSGATHCPRIARRALIPRVRRRPSRLGFADGLLGPQRVARRAAHRAVRGGDRHRHRGQLRRHDGTGRDDPRGGRRFARRRLLRPGRRRPWCARGRGTACGAAAGDARQGR